MAFYILQYDATPANVLPSGPAGAALSCGEYVYMDSSGNWQKAQAVADTSTSRKDALGVVVRDYLQYERCSPVKCAKFRGTTGQTIGGKAFLSGTAGAFTATEPTTTVRQVVGFFTAATEWYADTHAAGADELSGGDAYIADLVVSATSSLSGDVSIIDTAADADCTDLAFKKQRSGAIVQDGDDIGHIDFMGYNGTTYDTAVQILAEVNGTPGASTDMPGKLTVKVTADGSATPGEVFNVASGAITLADSVNIAVNTSNGTKIGTATSQKIGFFNATPIEQPGAYTQTYSTADKTVANPTCVSMGDLVATSGGWGASSEANFDKITTAVDQIIADNLDLRQAVTAIIDDLQALGLVG